MVDLGNIATVAANFSLPMAGWTTLIPLMAYIEPCGSHKMPYAFIRKGQAHIVKDRNNVNDAMNEWYPVKKTDICST